jgi:hypothetical protein
MNYVFSGYAQIFTAGSAPICKHVVTRVAQSIHKVVRHWTTPIVFFDTHPDLIAVWCDRIVIIQQQI